MSEITLKEYFERRIDHLDRRVTELYCINENAVNKANATMSDRLDSMNEFRDALKDQASRMATRLELEKLEEEVNFLQRAKANLDGRLIAFSGGLSVITSVVMWFIFKGR